MNKPPGLVECVGSRRTQRWQHEQVIPLAIWKARRIHFGRQRKFLDPCRSAPVRRVVMERVFETRVLLIVLDPCIDLPFYYFSRMVDGIFVEHCHVGDGVQCFRDLVPLRVSWVVQQIWDVDVCTVVRWRTPPGGRSARTEIDLLRKHCRIGAVKQSIVHPTGGYHHGLGDAGLLRTQQAVVEHRGCWIFARRDPFVHLDLARPQRAATERA